MFTFLLSIGGVVPCLNKHVNNLSRLFGKMIGQKFNFATHHFLGSKLKLPANTICFLRLCFQRSEKVPEKRTRNSLKISVLFKVS